tara:strand:- start:695 stop:964 length:270 start_codon:yes stop_codon:yes gene_type:complete
VATLSKNIDISEHKTHENDTGSVPVQIAKLTSRINHLTDHFKENPKDNHSKYGFLNIIALRQKLLKYYKRTARESYYALIQKLSIRDKG